MTDTDTSALRALGGAATRGSRWVYGGQGLVFANTDVVGAPYGEFRDLFASVQNDQDGVYLVALVNAAPGLLNEIDKLRGQVAPCDGGCDYSSGPEETCSLHGRKVAEVWKIVEQLQGQVARVDNIRKSLEDAGMTVTRQHGSEMPSEWVEWVNAPVDSVLGIIGQALAIPAEPAGVSRELIEQVRWAEANPNAVALDDVEAKRRRTAKSSSQQKRVREMGESDWSNVAPFDTESEIQQSRRTAEGGEHVHLFESDGCITVGCTTQVCAACGHVENPHIEGCKAAEGGE